MAKKSRKPSPNQMALPFEEQVEPEFTPRKLPKKATYHHLSGAKRTVRVLGYAGNNNWKILLSPSKTTGEMETTVHRSRLTFH